MANGILRELLKQNRQPLWLPELRSAFAQTEDAAPLILRLRSFDGQIRDYFHRIPRWESEAERSLARDYLCATVYNTLSVCGGYALTCYADLRETQITELLKELPDFFQISRRNRTGFGKVINIANRMGQAFGEKEFSLRVSDIKGYSPVPPEEVTSKSPVAMLRRLCQRVDGLNCVGIDVGGTDIKLAASARGKLLALKEYDWNPAAASTADEIIEPILLLTRLMRACVASEGRDGRVNAALRKDASAEEMAEAAAYAEMRYGTNVLDSVGLSFPDIVIHDRIVGGETPKTGGMRNNPALDYEREFARLGNIREPLLALCRDGGSCHAANDGSIAAFTAAVELSLGDMPETVEKGIVAHSLGTDLGTGILDAAGSIPQLPLELYDVWVDLGSAEAALPPEDLRSTRNENSGLPGVRRYLGQAAAYRLAWALDPSLLEGFVREEDGVLRIPTSPEDLRKPCLQHLMDRAAEGNPAADEVFRQIGRNLAMVSRELIFLLHSESDTRCIFGRFVKSARCFERMREGFREVLPGIELQNGGEGLANSPLMRQLAERGGVAQFAQAVGAIYYGRIGEETP